MSPSAKRFRADSDAPKSSVYLAFQALFNKLIVHAYKLTGFAALTMILLGLVSYFSINVFYFLSHSWLAPVIVSPTDKRVLELNAQFAQQASLRDSVAGQRLELGAKIRDADRIVVTEEAFQASFETALAADIAYRKGELAKLGTLATQHAKTGKEIARANDEFVGLSRDEIQKMYAAKLITRDDAVRGNLQVADLAGANLGLDVKNNELTQQIDSLNHDIGARSFSLLTLHGQASATSANAPSQVSAMSEDVLAIKHEYDRSKLDAERARDIKATLTQNAAALDAALVRYDALLASIKDSPYLKAVDKHVSVAFVPYDNIDAARAGAPVFVCRGNIVLCKPAGHIVAVLEGEVVGKHPTQNVDLRGVMVEIALDDFRSAESPVLHAGSKPLFF